MINVICKTLIVEVKISKEKYFWKKRFNFYLHINCEGNSQRDLKRYSRSARMHHSRNRIKFFFFFSLTFICCHAKKNSCTVIFLLFVFFFPSVWSHPCHCSTDWVLQARELWPGKSVMCFPLTTNVLKRIRGTLILCTVTSLQQFKLETYMNVLAWINYFVRFQT